jgi:ATP-binding cassette subfamily F protein 3
MVKTAEALARAESDSERNALAARYDRLNEMLRHHDAYNVDHRVEEVLDGLGFGQEEYSRPVDSFSGGQQSRLMLAKMLLAAPDVMLLDEPSNHLDIGATRWLEDYLACQAEAMLIVSHDRYFLNRVVTKTFELHDGRITSYPGNYQQYWRLRQERYEQQLKAWQAQQEYVDKQEEYIRRVHYGQLHKQAQSRQKALDRLERVERPRVIESPQMHFGAVGRSGDVVLEVEGLAKSYDVPLFKDLTFSLHRGQRLGILGANGSGKTTLLRLLMGEEEPDRGSVKRGHLVQFGYYDQHLKILADDLPVNRAVLPEEMKEAKDQDVRNLLARFGLTGEVFSQRVGELSGGERSRVALARLVASGANVLVLDEPTNHLDLWACDALEQALLDFEGTTIVVSHDRFFLNRVASLVIALEEGGSARVVFGNYDDYERLRRQELEAARQLASRQALPELPGEQAKPSPPKLNRRKRRFPYRKVQDLEADIAAAEARLREVERLLASPELYRDGDRVKETTRAFAEVKACLQQLYEHWEEAVELS